MPGPSLIKCLTLPDDHDWGGLTDTQTGPYYHHDNGCRVLGVAHLDTVMKCKPCRSGHTVFAPQLDDRLGVWCLLNALPSMGIKLDVLLTTGEEKCRSTASQFYSDKYNWIVEFDRAGDDIVFYQYEDFSAYWPGKVGMGSYSDIASMELGVMAANVGIGYHHQHTRYCYADLRETAKQLRRFARFFKKYENTRFPFTDDYYFSGRREASNKRWSSKYDYRDQEDMTLDEQRDAWWRDKTDDIYWQTKK